MKINFKRYILYLIRWQLSTPILAICVIWFAFAGSLWATVIANLIGGLIFFWIDKFIFQSHSLDSSWQIKEEISCFDCGQISRGYRLVKSENYNRETAVPEFRCEKCSIQKSKKLKKDGVKI